MGGYYLVERAKGPAWDHSRPRRKQVGWDEHAAFMDALVEEGFMVEADGEEAVRARLAEDPWPEEVLTIESVRPWSVWLRRNPGP